jgi:hypothetical protein
MKFLSIYKTAERGVPPTQEEMAKMGKLVEEGMKAGWLLGTEGCLPSALGARVRSSNGKLSVTRETQEEVDELWEKLSSGGKKERCGWLKDKYGLSWQIIPTTLGKLLSDADPEKSSRVMKAMLQMDKIDIARLQQAYQQQ